MLYPFYWRDTVGGFANDFAEMLGGNIQQIGIIFDLPRLPIVFYYQVAEAVEDVNMAVLCPFPVLITTVVIKNLIAHGELRQQGLIAMGQFLVRHVGNNGDLV